MAGPRGPRWWWTMAVLPAMAVSACGGSRLTHDAVVAAVNGGSLPIATAPQQQQGAVSARPPNGGMSSASGGATLGGVSGGVAAPVTAPRGTVGAGAVGAGSAAGTGAGSAPSVARPAAPLAPILLGNVGTYTGPASSTTTGGDTIVQVWALWTNAHGGVAGHPVQVFTADDGGDPQRSVSLLKDMVENKHVIAFVNDMVPFTSQAQLTYLHQHDVPIVGGDLVTPIWFQDSLAFPQGTTMSDSLFADFHVAHQRNLTKLGVVTCVESSACTYGRDYALNGGASKAGETVVYQSQVSLTQPDFTAQCLGAQSAGAQVILVGMDTNSIARFAASCSRQSYHPLYVGSAIQASLGLEGNPDVEGFLTASPVFPFMRNDTPAAAEFHQAVEQYAPSLPPSGSAAFGWAAGQLLAKAAARVGAQPTSQDILSGLWSLHGETVNGLTPPLTYARNQPSPPVPCYFLIEIKGGRWTSPSSTYACP
jgi:branched-chain amino acid transport system substrate-binding protein